jgi:hypothetical protein
MVLIVCTLRGDSFKIDRLSYNPALHFLAADILVLVTKAHMGKSSLCQCIKCHRSGIIIPGNGIPGGSGKPLPALKPEGLVAQVKRSSVDKQHTTIGPFHGHSVKQGKKGRSP